MIEIYKLLLLLLFIKTSNADFFSRFKNNEQNMAANNFLDLDSLDDQTFKNLLQDLPQLRHMLETGETKYRRKNFDLDPFGLDGPEYGDEGDSNDTDEYPRRDDEELAMIDTSSTRMPYNTRWPLQQPAKGNQSRRYFLFPGIGDWGYVGTIKQKCYWCGLYGNRIPTTGTCHDLFDSQDGRARALVHYYRAYCYKHPHDLKLARKKIFVQGGYTYAEQKGFITEYYGHFVGGCFKRFLDVGTVYTQRGCRHWYPVHGWHYTRFFVAHRFKRLELILEAGKKKPRVKKKKHIPSGCIVSPHASLTPFSRGISLYARYHVCVCYSDYCNGTSLTTACFTYVAIALLICYHLVQ